jgi:predicted nucleotidyltransferase
MVAEKQINEFISRLRAASGENFESVILYGSAADGEFHPDFSNVNLLCVLRETSFAALVAIAPAVEWWTKQKHHEPLILTREELESSTDVSSSVRMSSAGSRSRCICIALNWSMSYGRS